VYQVSLEELETVPAWRVLSHGGDVGGFIPDIYTPQVVYIIYINIYKYINTPHT
jgi:hypothetical protein